MMCSYVSTLPDDVGAVHPHVEDLDRARLHTCHFSSGRLQAARGACTGALAMLSDREPKYKRPRRLCIGVTRDKGKPIYAEGFGEWKREECTFLDEDSDDSLPNNGFEVRFHHKTLLVGLELE